MRRSKAREAGQGRFESEHIIALSCDLRLLSAADLAAQLRTSRQVVVAPDEEGTGTNPMLTRSSAQISSRLGPKSFCSHIREAESLGAKIAVVKRPGLENDLDLPEQSLWIGGSPGRWGPSA